MNARAVLDLELGSRISLKRLNIAQYTLYLCLLLLFRVIYQAVDLVHLLFVPSDLSLSEIAITTTKQPAILEHVCILTDKVVQLELPKIEQLVMELLALLLEYLVSIFLSPAHTL